MTKGDREPSLCLPLSSFGLCAKILKSKWTRKGTEIHRSAETDESLQEKMKAAAEQYEGEQTPEGMFSKLIQIEAHKKGYRVDMR